MSAPHEDLTAAIGAIRGDDGAIDARKRMSGNDGSSPGVAIVDREQCRAWRVAVGRGATQRELAEVGGVDQSTVSWHVNDRCKHVSETETETVGAGGQGEGGR